MNSCRFIDTEHAKQGDLGSQVLPQTPTGVVWTRGTNVEAKWGIRANHGGGYQYVIFAFMMPVCGWGACVPVQLVVRLHAPVAIAHTQ